MKTIIKISTSLILIAMASVAQAENLPPKDVVVPINEAFPFGPSCNSVFVWPLALCWI